MINSNSGIGSNNVHFINNQFILVFYIIYDTSVLNLDLGRNYLQNWIRVGIMIVIELDLGWNQLQNWILVGIMIVIELDLGWNQLQNWIWVGIGYRIGFWQELGITIVFQNSKSKFETHTDDIFLLDFPLFRKIELKVFKELIVVRNFHSFRTFACRLNVDVIANLALFDLDVDLFNIQDVCLCML